MSKSSELKIKKKEINKKIIFVLKGQLSADTISEFEKNVDELSNVGEGITVDLAGVDYISSSGLRLLLRLSKMTHAFRKEYKIINVRNEVYDIFDVTGFTDILNIKKKKIGK